MKTRNIALASIVSAIGFIFLFLAAMVPSGKLACLCIASACICVVVMESGKAWGIIAGVLIAVLGWLLVPDKMIVLLFTAFFSYYPVLKAVLEKIPNLFVGIILKLCFFAIIIGCSLGSLQYTGFVPERILMYVEDGKFFALIIAVGAAGLMLFDYALTRVIMIYLNVVKPKINR